MAQYYDLILGLIPLALGGITTVLVALGVSLTVAVPLAAAVSVALIGHGMFINSPVTESTPRTDATPVNSAD